MIEIIQQNFNLFKTVHLLAIISWMAGLLYLPRLFVYHAQVPAGSPQCDMLQTMERRLYTYIMAPAMVLSWLFGGLLLASYGAAAHANWIMLKLAAVACLTWVHYMCGAHLRCFAAQKNTRNHRYFRIFNEIPTLLLVVIVVCVVYKF